MNNKDLINAINLLTRNVASYKNKVLAEQDASKLQLKQVIISYDRIRGLSGLDPIQNKTFYLSKTGLYLPMDIKLIP